MAKTIRPAKMLPTPRKCSTMAQRTMNGLPMWNVMTSPDTMMAAVPPALALGPGSETRGPMALAIIGGLIVSTLLSLVVVPSFYVVADRWKAKLARLLRKDDAEAGAAEA